MGRGEVLVEQVLELDEAEFLKVFEDSEVERLFELQVFVATQKLDVVEC